MYSSLIETQWDSLRDLLPAYLSYLQADQLFNSNNMPLDVGDYTDNDEVDSDGCYDDDDDEWRCEQLFQIICDNCLDICTSIEAVW